MGPLQLQVVVKRLVINWGLCVTCECSFKNMQKLNEYNYGKAMKKILPFFFKSEKCKNEKWKKKDVKMEDLEEWVEVSS